MLGAFLMSIVVSPSSIAQSFPLDSTEGLQPHGVEVKTVMYQGRKAVQGDALGVCRRRVGGSSYG